jgi:hypothetical protein
LTFAFLVGCAPVPISSCAGLSRGDRIELTIIEPYDSNSQFQRYPNETAPSHPCGLGIDLSGGQVLQATVVDFRGEVGCAAVLTYGPVGDWTWELAYTPSGGDHFLYGVYKATRGQCAGNVEVKVFADSTPFVAPVRGQLPHVILTRSLNLDANNPACPTIPTAYVNEGGVLSCSGSFVVSAKRL